ncbi:cation-translocating P-type ATPase [Thermoanaerobacter pentosaceus]|uniref:Ca2+-transporting ATPase n=1 Tax=Thermoanaerobacter pentosaceus TaxID=694059 RepID=A0ABT9M204_9THEO|nr:cation-translocating P-type ATPase [Thermoanaerobacter pentosaceus]MDP9750124.1 Ca2+-transporting ATPase [Thermoanaerobacter pentosaceus]
MAKINGFKGDYTGLSDEEVAKLQLKYGKNDLVPQKRNTLLSRILTIFKEPMILLLFGTALIYFLLGEYRDGIIMLIFVMFVTSISFFQEWKTDRTLNLLKNLTSPKVKVIRNGHLVTIDSRELTVGDLMLLEEGDKVPADGQIIEMHDLGIDESALTGESEICWKKVEITPEENNEYWKKNCCYAGTTVISGTAIVKVTAIGLNTEYGKIGVDVNSAPEYLTPLEKQTRKLIIISLYISICLFVVVFLVTFIHQKNLIDGILSGITITMAIIPEEFPVVLTVFLAMGAWRLAKRNALIRRIPAIETLGAISVLCVDKTGTLTKNQMEVRHTYVFNDHSERELINYAVLACEEESYDPMEKAIKEYGEKNGLDVKSIYSKKLIHEYPFSSDLKMMGHVWEIDGKPVLTAKGSPESILPLCHLDDKELNDVKDRQFKMASNGYRVIAVAKNDNMSIIPKNITETKMDLIGLIGLADPPKEAVPDAIDICNEAGIRIVLITGDNGITAQAIAEEIGIKNYNNVITGQELDKISEEDLRNRVKKTNIFARVTPRHKMRIVKAFKENGEVVAMTGDGVNDAPALKYADIGIAMGKRGTGVAKDAADMVLLDDNFTTIVDTIRDGRRIYDNIKKAFGYIIAIHIPIALTAILTPLLHLPLLLLPVHVVLLELIIDPTCSIVFEREPAEDKIMKRNPRPQSDPLISVNLGVKSILQGVAIFTATFVSYLYMINNGFPQNMGRSFSLTVIVLANLLLVYINGSETDNMFKVMFKQKDKAVWYVNIGVFLGLLAILYIPSLNDIVKTAPLNLFNFLKAAIIAFLSTAWWELVKLYNKNKLSLKQI